MIDKAELKIGTYVYFGSKSSPSAKEGQKAYPYVDPKSCYYKWKILDIKDDKILLFGDALRLEYGMHIDYIDEMTLGYSLKGRTKI